MCDILHDTKEYFCYLADCIRYTTKKYYLMVDGDCRQIFYCHQLTKGVSYTCVGVSIAHYIFTTYSSSLIGYYKEIYNVY